MKCEEPEVWKRSCRLSVEVHQHFKDQITRSALSVGSNIAEGMEKESTNENLRFLEIAKGSTGELITQIYIGIEFDYIDREKGFAWIRECNELLMMIKGLQSHIKSKNP